MIDIIIPAFNAHETIEYTLMSIAMQKIKNKTTIYMIDDNSINNYDSIINKFNSFLNIKLVRLNTNVGPAKTRQYALDISKGKYIVFIDADDLLKNPDSLEILYNEIKQGYDYVCSKTYYEELNSEHVNNGDLHGKIYRRSFLDKNNIYFFDYRCHEDNAFNNLVLMNNPKISNINETTYIYTLNNNSITHNPFKDQTESLEIYIQTIKKVIEKSTDDNCSQDSINNYIKIKENYLRSIYSSLSKKDKSKLNLYLKKYNLNKFISLN